MIEQGIKALRDLAVTAATPVTVYEDDEVKVISLNGAIQADIAKMPKPRHHEAHNLEDVIALANRFAQTGDFKPVVWYSANAVALIIDDAGHRVDRVDLALAYSDVFLKLILLREKQPTFKHRAFVKFLRTELINALPSSILLDKISKLEFSEGSIVVGSHKKGEESMGKTIHAKVSKAEEIPDSVMLEFPVYKTRGLQQTFTMRCLLEIDPFEEQFQLIPAPDAIESTIHRAMDMVSARLQSELIEGIPHYQGKP